MGNLQKLELMIVSTKKKTIFAILCFPKLGISLSVIIKRIDLISIISKIRVLKCLISILERRMIKEIRIEQSEKGSIAIVQIKIEQKEQLVQDLTK